tara:strand:+ start:1664 stop:1897 length:234 start_codon:yes stop_codon:yes gene_type:complete
MLARRSLYGRRFRTLCAPCSQEHSGGYVLAARDIRELRDLLDARRTAWQTIIKVVKTGVLTMLLLGVAIKLKLFGVN